MRLRTLLAAAAVFCATLSARADTFSFTLNGGASGISGSGTLTANANGSNGAYLVSGISGTDVTGLIAPGAFAFSDPLGVSRTNDNLFFPNGINNFDGQGLGFYAQNASGTYDVSLFYYNSTNPGIASGYYAAVTETNTTVPSSGDVPVTFTFANTAATPEPSSLALLGTGALAVAGAMRRRLRS